MNKFTLFDTSFARARSLTQKAQTALPFLIKNGPLVVVLLLEDDLGVVGLAHYLHLGPDGKRPIKCAGVYIVKIIFIGKGFCRGSLSGAGGSVDAADGIGNYWRNVFGGNVEAYVPHLAFSCGTLLAFACNTIHMTKASGLGPADPALGERRAESIIADFEHALADVSRNANLALVWNPILEKHGPCAYEEALRAREYTEEIARNWLKSGMLRDAPPETVETIVSIFNSHKATKSHGRQFPYGVLKNLGLNVSLVEDDPELQDLLMTIHHAATLFVEMTGNAKLIINANGKGKVFAP